MAKLEQNKKMDKNDWGVAVALIGWLLTTVAAYGWCFLTSYKYYNP
jgi:hypothetical protein